jgi:hypothetical protein
MVTLASEVVGTGPRLQMLTEKAEARVFEECLTEGVDAASAV